MSAGSPPLARVLSSVEVPVSSSQRPAPPRPSQRASTSRGPASGGSTSRSSAARGSRKQWILPAVLVAGCVATGSWSIPQVQQAQQLREGSQASSPAPSAEPVPTLAPSGAADTAAMQKSLKGIVGGFTAGNMTGLVVDAASGETVFASGAERPRVPASNFKLLTDYTLLRTVNPQSRFTTEVVASGKTLTLVAGGDTLLGTGESDESAVVGHAGLRTLAQRTVDELKKQGPGTYTLNLDASRFSGPGLNPAWDPADVQAQFVNAVAPIAFYSHFSPAADGSAGDQRPEDPAGQVHAALVESINELGASAGISVKAGGTAQAQDGAQPVAQVRSATVAQQAAYMMQESDNMLAETLARNAAVAAGKPGSIEGARQTVLETLQADGISTDGVKISDLCGLSPANRVTNTTLAQVTRAMVNGEHDLSAALAGLPVAGGSGTLDSRFDDPAEASARGFARGKTGTLNSVISLTGYTTDASGRTYIYSLITNDVTDPAAAKDALDEAVAAVTGRR